MQRSRKLLVDQSKLIPRRTILTTHRHSHIGSMHCDSMGFGALQFKSQFQRSLQPEAAVFEYESPVGLCAQHTCSTLRLMLAMAKRAGKIKPLTGNAGDFSGIVLKAAARGDARAVRHYLKINPGWLNQEGPHGRTLLWEAGYKGRTELVAELIRRGASVCPLGSYYTPMLVELSALAVAREAGRDELAQLLVSHGATDDFYAACHRGDLNAVNEFINRDPECVNRPAREVEHHPRMGFHPIHYAAAGKQLGVARLLVGSGAEIDDHLPLLIDWAEGDRELTRFFKQHSKAGKATALNAGQRSEKRSVKVPSIDRPDWMGFPPLVDACRGNHNAPDDPERVVELLDRGANVNVIDHKQKTPLHRAGQAGFLKITKLLIKHGANLESVDESGGTPLFDAALHGRTATVELLIEAGADLKHLDARGETPLFAAARRGHHETFLALIDAGADWQHLNNRGKSIFDVVRSARHQTEGRTAILAERNKLK